MPTTHNTFLDHAEIIASTCRAMPLDESLLEVREDVSRAIERGYFLPDEDERLREMYRRYLRTRTVLLESIVALESFAIGREEMEWEDRMCTFAAAFAAATVLVRSAKYIVDIAADQFLVWKKLDEAELRYGIAKNSFSAVFKNLTSSRRMWRFYESIRFYELHKEEIYALAEQGGVVAELVEILKEEEEFLEFRKRDYLKRRLRYTLHSFVRRHHTGYKKAMFHIFRLSGSAIAEMKQPIIAQMKAGKRVTPRVLAKAWSVLQPGDIIITRHDDAMSNLFLPGFWPHAAFYIGSYEQRVRMGLEDELGLEADVVEAKKDGVKYRKLAETLTVDAFVILRPKLSEAERLEAVRKAMSHAGKRYDFLFDFSRADRLACTEVVYRSYHAVGEVSFQLQDHAGRKCLSAENMLDQAISSGNFEPVAIYGVRGIKVQMGEDVRPILQGSYKSCWD
ncbi:hypothetical protein Rhal01_02820 [Rubritalea halochordaticola]|uniref:Permuted papain-like amidase YaeF/Yiix C92 family enzyme n=1 Tax=Rubritalea halochordaticola TaxID=714537 RepID=A0ABP9V1Z0_9BACT